MDSWAYHLLWHSSSKLEVISPKGFPPDCGWQARSESSWAAVQAPIGLALLSVSRAGEPTQLSLHLPSSKGLCLFLTCRCLDQFRGPSWEGVTGLHPTCRKAPPYHHGHARSLSLLLRGPCGQSRSFSSSKFISDAGTVGTIHCIAVV